MEQRTIKYLRNLAQQYNNEDFIPNDPISFPHRYTEKKDIEISAFIAQWLAYGRREMFLRVLDNIGEKMGNSPYEYILSKSFSEYKDDEANLYRFYKKKDFYDLCSCLYDIYAVKGERKLSMEDVLKQMVGEKTEDFKLLLQILISLFPNVNGVPQNTFSACKRLCMFLRWLVRKDGIVDFGIWDIISPQHLVIPVDTHVFKQSKHLGLTQRNDTSFKTAQEITENLKEIFPSDPVLGDFALFGYGVDKQKLIDTI